MNKIIQFFAIFLLFFSVILITGCNKKNDKEDDDKTEQFIVKYDAKDGAFADGNKTLEETYENNKRVNLISEEPQKEGYKFIGWFDQETDKKIISSFIINKNTTLIAKYELITYTVTYTSGVGLFSNGQSEIVLNVAPNSLFEMGDIPTTSSGRLFNGWYNLDTQEEVDAGYVINGDLKVFAKYARPGEVRDLTYVINGGTQEEPLNVSYYENIKYVLSVPTKEGFAFEGWYTSSDFSGEPVKKQNDDVKGDQIYYAKWRILSVDYIDVIIDELLPSELDKDITLPSEYQGVKLYWTTDSPSSLTPRGVVKQSHRSVKVHVKCQVTFEEEFYDVERDVTVKAIQFEELINPVAGYFYNTTVKNPSDFMLENFDIAYVAFATIEKYGKVNLNSGCISFMNQVEMLRKAGIRCIISINGGPDNFIEGYTANPLQVINDIVDIIKKYNLDGVDIDWEFPRNSIESDNMVSLCDNLRKRLDTLADGTGSPYLVTTAIPSHASYSKFNLKDLNEILDYFNMMSYDMNLEGRTTHLCPLFKGGNDGGMYSIPKGIENFVAAGVDKEKIIIGGAFYGKSYEVTGPVSMESRYPALGVTSKYTTLQYSSGTVTYKWLYNNILSKDDMAGYTRYYDKEAEVPYLYNEKKNIFITYEDEESLIRKTEYAYQEGLGIMFWDYSYDYNNVLTEAICKRMWELKNNIQPEE